MLLCKKTARSPKSPSAACAEPGRNLIATSSTSQHPPSASCQSRNSSPLHPSCPQLVPSAPLSGQVPPAPQLLPATPQSGATLLPLHRQALRPSLPSLSLASTEPTRVPWYDFSRPNWQCGDDGRMEWRTMGWPNILSVVHCGRQNQCSRPHRKVARVARRRFQEGRKACRDPSRPFALARRQAGHRSGIAEAHWQRRQGRHRQELPLYLGG
jgi:hypothetical protein